MTKKIMITALGVVLAFTGFVGLQKVSAQATETTVSTDVVPVIKKLGDINQIPQKDTIKNTVSAGYGLTKNQMNDLVSKVLILNKNGFNKGQMVKQLLGENTKRTIFSREKASTLKNFKKNFGLRDLKRTLKQGEKSTDVLQLQDSLNRLSKKLGLLFGFLSLDGQYGPATARAVKLFQEYKGINDDGIVGPHTRQKINNEDDGDNDNDGILDHEDDDDDNDGIPDDQDDDDDNDGIPDDEDDDDDNDGIYDVDELEIEVEIKDGQAEIEVEIGHEESKFILDTINKDEIIAIIAERFNLDADLVVEVIEFEYDNDNDSDDDDDGHDDDDDDNHDDDEEDEDETV